MRIIHVVVEILLLVHIYKKGLSLFDVSLKYEDFLGNQLQCFKTLSRNEKVSFLSISLTQPSPKNGIIK